MRPILIRSLLPLFLLTGCQYPKGRCTYHKNEITRLFVGIKAIKKATGRFGEYQVVYLASEGHQGYFPRKFSITMREYDRCIVGQRVRVGEKVMGIIKRGGPCPPMYKLKIGACTIDPINHRFN